MSRKKNQQENKDKNGVEDSTSAPALEEGALEQGSDDLSEKATEHEPGECTDDDYLAENAEALVETEEDFAEATETISTTSQITVVKSKFAIFLSLVSIAMILAVAYGGYYLWQQQENLKKGQEKLAVVTQEIDYGTSISAIRKNLDAQAEEFAGISSAIDTKVNSIAKAGANKLGKEVVRLEQELDKGGAERKGLARDIDRLMDIAAKNKLDWALAEVHYLVTIANNRLIFNKDIKTAIAALETANEKIRVQRDQRLYGLRQRIVDDINSLRAVKMPPLVQIAAMLNDIEMKIRELPVPEPKIDLENSPGSSEQTIVIDAKKDSSQDGKEEISAWRRRVNRAYSTFKDTLKDYVVVNYDSEDITPIMSADSREYLNQNLELKIQTMRISLANRDQDLFSNNLEIIESWVNRYFDKNDSKVLETVKMIWELKKIKLNPELPNVSKTIGVILAEKASIQRAAEKAAASQIKAQIK